MAWRLGLALALLATSGVRANDAFWQAVSDAVVPMVALGELSLYADGAQGRQAALLGLQALAVNAAETELLQSLVREQRPDHSDHGSFPSLHASTAFTMATIIDEYDSKYGLLAYAGAGLISYSRIELDKHHWQDVLGGAALGYLNGKLFAPHHFQVYPLGLTFSNDF